MSRIRALAILCIFWSAVACAERPNIVWIVADDMSPDMGCYGDSYAWTPNLDAFAEEGLRYTHAFAVNGQCAPSRSALLTGMYPTSIGTHHMRNQGLPPAQVKMLGHFLRAAGYYCSNNGKADYNLGNGPNERSGILMSPLGAWDAEGFHADWRGRDPDQPFFAVFNLAQTHESRLHFSDAQFEKTVSDVPSERRHDPVQAHLPAYYPDDPAFRKDWAKYHDLVSAMDIDAGRILEKLREDGLDKNTVVFFFGDHGRPLPRAKRWLYDSGLRVPLIVRWPGTVPPGNVTDEIVSFVDFAPTVLAIAGIGPAEHMQGNLFLGDARDTPRTYAFGQRDRVDELTDRVRSVRGARYHYLRNYVPEVPYAYPLDYMDRMPSMKVWRSLNEADALDGAAAAFFAPSRPEEELYDTHADPDEVRNLAESPEHAKILAKFRVALNTWIAESGDLGAIPEQELVESWRPNGVWSTTAIPESSLSSGSYEGPVVLALSCPTEGSVVEYTDEPGRNARWRLYTGPLQITESRTLRVRAGRLGYRDSEELELVYDVR